jgi:diphthamide synthase subunit DPH2
MRLVKFHYGKACLMEAQLIEYWMAQYFEEFDVNPERITEVHLISELAELDIYEMRVTKYLAENHQTLLQEVMTGVDPAGNVISNLEVSRAFDLKERLKKQRMKVLEALMATRKEKIKAIVGVTGGTDTASRISELKEKLEKLNRDVSAVTIDGESVRVS